MNLYCANLLITGGCGFIGSAFIHSLLKSEREGLVVNLDALTYAGDLKNLDGCSGHPKYRFVRGDINHGALVEQICIDWKIDAIVHFAAETHVDRSIASSHAFLDANVKGTLTLLDVVRAHPEIHFHHISTDEVYGSLGEGGLFTEHSHYRPNSPYAASKAASDHFVRAYAHTYGLSVTMSHCSNNYGPRQHLEKLIPQMISNCLSGQPLPIYGNGLNIRDWIYVEDHVEAIAVILERGAKGETYNIGGTSELTNLDLVHRLIDCLSREQNVDPATYRQLIRFVPDRPGHDFRYAIDSSKLTAELGWRAKTSLDEGLLKTIHYYQKINAIF